MAHHSSDGNRSAKREGGVESRKWAPDSACVCRMSGLTRDGTAEPNSRGQTLRSERGQGKMGGFRSVDDEQDWQPYPVDAQSAESDECWEVSPVSLLTDLARDTPDGWILYTLAILAESNVLGICD